MLLRLFVYKLRDKNGFYDEVEMDPLIQFDIRDVFSLKNETLEFKCDNCKQALKDIGAALLDRQLYSVLEIDSKQIPLNTLTDDIFDTNPTIYMLIACGIGLAYSIVGAISELNVDWFGLNKKKKAKMQHRA